MLDKPRYRVKAASRPLLNVVRLEPRSEPEVHSILDQFQTLAKDGKISGIAVSIVHHDGCVASAYHIGSNLFTMIGSARNVCRRLELEAKS